MQYSQPLTPLKLIRELKTTCENALADLNTIEEECEGVSRSKVTGIISELRMKIQLANKHLGESEQENQPNLPLDPLPMV
jgi:hypothetical protein